jgi:hypothetical protein
MEENIGRRECVGEGGEREWEVGILGDSIRERELREEREHGPRRREGR